MMKSKKQNVNLKSDTKFGEINLLYLDENSKVNDIVTNDTETIKFFYSKNFLNFQNWILVDYMI